MADENVKEEIKNCFGCKKHLSRAKRYYRNGHYYCNKNCFAAKKKALAEEAASAEG